MKQILLFISGLCLVSLLGSCCQCMNCPGSATYTGNPTDDICKDSYEASPSNQAMSWAQYSDYMLQNGCKCIK